MENLNKQQRILRYLRDDMPPEERIAFERDLKQDAALQQAYIAFQLSDAGDAYEAEREIRQIAQRVRQGLEPMPEPSVSWLDRLRYLFYAPAPKIIGAGILAIVAIALYVYLGAGTAAAKKAPLDLSAIPGKFFMEPFCTGIAGNNERRQQTLMTLHAASDFYCGVKNGGRDSLQALADRCEGYCMAHYYMAHWDFRMGDFAAAKAGFDAGLQEGALLKSVTYTSDLGKLKLNALLAELGATQNGALALQKVNALLADPDCMGDAKKKAGELKALLDKSFK